MTDNNSKKQTQPAKKTSEHPKTDEVVQFGLEIAPMPTLVSSKDPLKGPMGAGFGAERNPVGLSANQDGNRSKVEKSVVERLVQKVKDL